VFTSKSIAFSESGVLNSLVLNYLEKDEKLKPFYGYFPDQEGFRSLLSTDPYNGFDREKLVSILKRQSDLTNNCSRESLANIEKLNNNNAYTITTGHQLCLFTGPLYFIYKIFSAINLAEELKRLFPEKEFVPVYWMASEDHDFEEVNNFSLFGKTIKWESKQGGAVGDFSTGELEALLPEITEVLGSSDLARELFDLFKQAYLGQNNLADATRYLVNALFGQYGLVIVDGNDQRFKEQFKETFKNDIFDHLPHTKVNESIAQLEELGYSAQVTPRQINCFYLDKGSRLRFERSGETFNLVNSDRSFTQQELMALIEEAPEKISPNVTLRPIYQQVILPNIAYVGGPGELAYWLEYKSMFDVMRVQFPVLVPRNFILVADKATRNKIGKLGFLEEDFFKSERELIHAFQLKSNAVFETGDEKEALNAIYNQLTEKITAVDKSLSGSVSAELQKAINGLDMLSGKANKALKQKSETELNQIKAIRQKLFPSGTPQERVENFASFYLKYGQTFFSELKVQIRPFALDQKILLEA
jgi:bacillithiol biosynthesis cysteine-adding enzyme BshC